MTLRLGKMIREAVKAVENPSVETVTEQVFEAIPEAFYEQVIKTLLMQRVTTEIGLSRSVELGRVRKIDPDDFRTPGGTAEPEGKTFFDPGDDEEKPKLVLRDPKAQARIEAFLNEAIPVREGELKKIRDLTADDCRIVAETRFEQARQNVRTGQGYLKCAEVIEERGVQVLGDLNGQEVHKALTAA